MYLSIELTDKLRNLETGRKFDFDFSETYYKLIVGKNGAGKSTLINIIRDLQCDNTLDKTSSDWDKKLGYVDIKGFSNKAKIDTDFKKFFFLSSEFDDPTSLSNSASAESMIKNGGYMFRHKSNGERNFSALGKWLHENRNYFDENSLIIFDEADRGFELKYQVGFMKMMENLNKEHGVKFIAITHNVIPMLLSKEVYFFDINMNIPSKDYLAIETGYEFNVNKIS